MTSSGSSQIMEFGLIPLTDSEVARVEGQYRFRFPPDLRQFLQTSLPVSDRFPDWRSGSESYLTNWLNWPRDGLLFDVEHNAFWLPEWGTKPSALIEAHRIASEMVSAAPTLIPVYAHRMIPDEPHAAGNPVFSVHQSDIVVYGFDLADYLRNEFGLPGRQPRPAKTQSIRFWDVGSSRVDLQACKLEYSIVSPK